ncbi:MAG: arginine deiminase family protein [Candidatus Bathyarchaeota archaeon]|nr:arginine deiminase family protein [Candidatus Bathyarchaeota archaeon]
MPPYGITHESGTLKRVLVHHPGRELELANSDPAEHHFEQPVDVDRFIADHGSLMDALTEAGVEVLDVGTLLEGYPNLSREVERCPNLVFTRDSSAVTDAGALLMRMGLPSRRRETPIIKAAHENIGVPIGLQLEEPETFEGGGFALMEGRTAVAGLCQRTTKGALNAVRDFLFDGGVADTFIVLNVPPDDIHIDGDFAELSGRTALVHPSSLGYSPAIFYTRSEVWEGSFIEWLEEEDWDILEITDEERMEMAANFLTIDRGLAIHYTGNPRVMREVRNRGIDVIQIPGEEMRKGLGGLHCMTCPILRV